MTDTWYRADVRSYSVADEWGDHSYSTSNIVWQEYEFVRSTPKGVVLRGFMTGEVFILGKAKLQQAMPTKELALADAIARKKRHVWGCEHRLNRAKEDLFLLECALKAVPPCQT